MTLRRLEQEVLPGEVDFWAPPEVARLFVAMGEAMGGLEALLDHALATRTGAGSGGGTSWCCASCTTSTSCTGA